MKQAIRVSSSILDILNRFKMTLSVFIILLFYSQISYSQCSGNIYDPGGVSGNYGNNQNVETTYNAPAGSVMELTFNSIDLENNYDFLYIYDGPSSSAPLMYTLTGTTLPQVITSTGSTITLLFTSDGSQDQAGYDISLNCYQLDVCSEDVASGLIAKYDFKEGLNDIVHDVSGFGTPLNLKIDNTSNVTWDSDCGVDVNSSTIIKSGVPASKIISEIKSTNAFSIEAWVQPSNITQSGPARIVSISNNTIDRNITLGQEGTTYASRIRTTTKTNNGTPQITGGTVDVSAPQHVVYTWDGSTLEEEMFVDGVLVYQGTQDGDLSNWDDTYQLMIANEFTEDRAWLGKVYSVSIYNKALSLAEVGQNLYNGQCCAGNSAFDPIYGCGEGVEIEMFYTGLNNDVPKTLSFNNIDNIDSVLVEIVYKSNNPGAITIQDANGNPYTASPVTIGAFAFLYTFKLPSTSYVYYGNTTMAANAQSIVAYVYRQGQPGKSYSSKLVTIGAYPNTTNIISIPLPSRDAASDISVALPITEITYDDRILNFSASAGGVTTSFTKMWGPSGDDFIDGCCVDSVLITLENVPASATEFGITIESPPGAGIGQSYVLAGLLYTEVECYVPEICDDGIDNDNDGFTDCEDLDCGQVENREFDNGTTDWFLYSQTGSSADLKLDQFWNLSGANSAFIDISAVSGTHWHIQFGQSGFSVEAGKTYEFYFDAKATGNRTINASTQLDKSPWTGVSSQTFNITTSPQSFSYDFTSPETFTDEVNLYFNLGSSTENVWIDNVQLKEVCLVCEADAGPDQTQCQNSVFDVAANKPLGTIGTWSIVSGSATALNGWNSYENTFTIPTGTTTLRWSVTDGDGCDIFDDIVLSNTTDCSTECIDPLNVNGDLEDEGSATNFDLNFKGNPAQLIDGNNNPSGWAQRYGDTAADVVNFNGAFYVNTSNAYSGDHMIYLKGNNFCLSPLAINTNISCGKTYKFALYAAAYTFTGDQSYAPFAIEASIGNSSNNPPSAFLQKKVLAPASLSLPNLDWNRYEFEITVPDDGYEYVDFYLTSFSDEHGIFIDDVCITEVFSGSDANAGADISNCENSFDLQANTPPAGYSGSWSVVSGAVSFASNNPNTTATITSGNVATVRWTVSDGSCSYTDDVVIGYETLPSLSTVDGEACPGGSADISVVGCTGDILWETGENTSTISVSAASSSTYSVSCTESSSANVMLNGGFESATDMENWSNWAGTSITTTASDVRTGNKALLIDASTNWAGMGQYLSASPGEMFTLTFWAKTTNANANPKIGLKFFDNSGNATDVRTQVAIVSNTYEEYTLSVVAPLNTTQIEIGGSVSSVAKAFIDDMVMTKGNNCTRSATANVTILTPKELSVSNNGPVSCNMSTVTLTLSNGSKPIPPTYSFLWESGNTGNTETVNSAGTYTVTVTDDNGCTSTASTIVTSDLTGPNASVAVAGIITCDDLSSTLTANPSGLSYLWSTGETSRVISVTEGGYYDVTVTGSNGCDSEARGQVIQDNEPPTVVLEDVTICNGDVATLTPIICENYPVVEAQRPLPSSGWANVFGNQRSALVGDGELCFTLDSLNLDSPQMFGLNADPNTSNSYSNIDYAMYVYIRSKTNYYSISIRESGTSRGTVYSSSTSYVGSQFCVKRTGTTIEYLMDGTVLYTSTVASNNDLFYDHSVHSGGGVWTDGYSKFNDISLCGELDLDYSWNTGATSQTIDVSAGGTYTLEVTDAKGCKATDVANVVSNDPISLIASQETICECVESSSTGIGNPFESTMGFNAFIQNNVTVKGGETEGGIAIGGDFEMDGQYNISINTAGGFTADGDAYPSSLVIEGKIIYTSGSQIYVNQNGYIKLGDLTGSNVYDTDNNGANVNLRITPGSYLTSPQINSQNQQSASTVNQSGLIDFDGLFGQYVGTSNELSSQSENASINSGGQITLVDGEANYLNVSGMELDAFPTLSFSTKPSAATPLIINIDNNGTLDLSAPNFSGLSGSDGQYVILNFYNSTTINLTGATVIGTILAPIAVLNKQGSSNIEGQVIAKSFVHHSGEIHNQPFNSNVLPVSSNVCIDSGREVTLSATGGGTYEWSTGSNSQVITVNPVITTTYKVTVTSSNGCTETDQVVVNVESPIAVTTSVDNEICEGGSTQIEAIATGGSGSFEYSWNNALGNGAQKTVSPNKTTVYSVTVTDLVSGCESLAHVNVIVNPIPLIDLGDQEICPGESVTLSVKEGIEEGGLIDHSTWTEGTGSVGEFSKNGTDIENHRILSTDPWGNETVVWEARPEAASGADGGWNTGRFDIDNSKTYRVSVWVNRKVRGADGRFYIGTRGYGSTNGVKDISTGSNSTNPYFFVSNNSAINLGDEDEWVLVVGHVYANDYTGNTLSPESGRYTTTDGKIGEITKEFKWLPETTESLHRSYLFYSTDTDVRQQWVYPRFDIVDGTEPSINDLLNGYDVKAKYGNGSEWTWYTNSCGGTPVGTGQSIIVSPTTTTEYFVRGEGDCNTLCESVTVTVNTPPNASIDNEGPITCSEPTTDLKALPAGMTYLWEDGSTDQIRSVSSDGTYYVTVTNNKGCEDIASSVVTTTGTPTVSLGDSDLCLGESTTLSPTTGGSWSSSDTDVAIVSNNGSVISAGPGTATFTFVDGTSGCSATTSVLTVNPDLSIAIDNNGSSCIQDGSQLTAVPTGGSPTYMYDWRFPDNSTATGETVSISLNGNYYLTVTDNAGCTAETSGFIYAEFEPFIFSLETTVCEGESVDLSINGSNITAYAWDSNAGNANTPNVTVTPSAPSSTYIVTVTNSNGCTSTASATIGAEELPVADAGVDQTICENETVSISTTDAGAGATYAWNFGSDATPSAANGAGPHDVIFNNPLANGANRSNTVTLVVTKGDCSNTDTKNVTILAQPDPSVTFSSPSCGVDDGSITFTFADNIVRNTILFSIDGGVTFPYNTNDNVGTYTVSNLASGDYDLVTKWSDNSCALDLSTVTLADNEEPTISNSGDDSICIGSTTILNASSSGTWSSDNNAVATVSAAGVVEAVSQGVANISFIADNNCAAPSNIQITVTDKETVTISGDDILCEGTTTILSASTGGGTWSSDNTSIATVNSSGVVTAVGAGVVLINYDQASSACVSSASYSIEVFDTPTSSVTGSIEICVGESTNVSTDATGGFWTSSDNNIAIVSSTGLVTGIAEGNVSFYYTTSDNCPSPNTGTVTVTPPVSVAIDFNGSECLTEDSQLSAIVTGGTSNFSYSWSGPGGFTGNTQTVDISLDGNYNLTVTDSKGCTDVTSAFVYESYEPFIFALNTTVCEDESVTLSVSGASATGYQWSVNAGSASTQSVTVIPTVPSSSYTVTVTNSIGCTTEATANIAVNAKPVVSITGSSDLCIGETTQLSPSTGGEWTSANSSVATVTNGGEVTAVANGSTTFTFKSNSTNCISEETNSINVGENSAVTISGDNQICFSDNPTLTASVVGGAWSSANNAIATIDANGVVTPHSQGTTTILYEVSDGGCYDDGTYSITINNDPTVSLNGPSTICEGDNTFVNSSMNGTWTCSDLSVATISSSGVITGVGAGTASISFTSAAGCIKGLNTPITVIANPTVVRLGPAEICINNTSSLSPTSGGIWISSNNNIASVNSSGVVTGKAVGTAIFTFIESTNGCVSENTISIQVYGPPTINGLSDSNICIGEITSITPSSGGTWASSDESIATISDNGVITAVGQGTAKFTFTSDATGCNSGLSEPLTVNGNPIVNYTGLTEICIGEQTNISPTTGGQWTSSDVSVATISQSGVITGVNSGTVSFVYTSNATGCSSDASEPMTVKEPTTIVLTGPSTICVGEVTIITPNTGGTWSSSNEEIATITNSGVITGHTPGIVSFTFNSSTSCTSDPSIGITVIGNPNTAFSGPTEICIGSTTNVLPNTGGTWTASDTNVATVNNSGLVTAIGFGTAQFTYVDNNSGCQSTTDGTLSVYNKPVPEIIGDDEICVGFTTYMTPTTGGVWTSSNTSVAVISSNGVVTGISPGTVTFTFYESGSNCVSDASAPVTILQKAPVAITGDNTICVGETTTVSPTTGGSWVSSNPLVATVSSSGVVSGITQGIAKFTFISDSGCESDETAPVIVFGAPTISISGPSQVCIGDEVQMLPTSGGTWTSSNTSVATIGNNGVVTTLSSGIVNFTYVNEDSGCSSVPSENLTVSPAPNTSVNGPSDICIGSVTYLTPSSGGIWTALDPEIATIQNNGQVSGISAGNARFVFTQLSTGCQSEENNDITVLAGPTISFTGPTEICEGETTNITSANPGTWQSSDPSIASITNGGLITGVSAGIVTFTFTETTSGCTSEASKALVVNGPPTVFVDGTSVICASSTTTLSPNSGGTWQSENPEIATTTDNGVVTGVSEGIAFFTFTDDLTGCQSDGLLSVEVLSNINVDITGDTEICTGYTTTLSPNTGGTWISSNPLIATVSNSGVVKGKAPGIVTFTFVDSETGCSAGGTSDPVTVSNCINHDFNVALVNQTILGNVNTNDNVPNTATYSNIKQLVEKPLASLPQLTINPDGTYNFTTNKAGKYIYKVPVCMTALANGCPSAYLEINVLDNVYGHSNPVSNLEYTTIFANVNNALPGNTVTIAPLANDDCVYTVGCNLDEALLSIIDAPAKGTILIMGAGEYDYTPNAGFIGQDTIVYQICESVGNCSTSSQIITVNAPNALNSVVASDDFDYTLKGINTSGNVITNDSDPENDNISVVQQGSMMSPIVITEGEYYFNNDGTYGFTPNATFSGALDIVYTLCDDNTEVACTDATLHIQVLDDLSLRLKVYLEGALMDNLDNKAVDGRPLMRDGLRNSPFTGKNYIPVRDPYTFYNETFDDTPDKFVKVGPGLLAENLEIIDSLAVFSVTGENAIVDWVHIEIRDKNDNKVVLATRSGLLQRDGDVVDLDGTSALRFQGINIDSFYVCVRHRTHLGVMSEIVSNGTIVDFTSPTTPIFNYGTSLPNGLDYTGLSQKSTVKSGYLALWAGDFNSDGKLKFTEPASDINILYGNVLFTSPEFLINYDFTLGYFRGDYNMDGKAKYANPNDDRNFLQGQIIFHPLNTNFISNLDGVIQQVPND